MTIQIADSMRAAEFDEYGSANVLKVRRVPRPLSAQGEAVVRIHASTPESVTSPA